MSTYTMNISDGMSRERRDQSWIFRGKAAFGKKPSVAQVESYFDND